jgi:HPt (histidine-containing phosphotransfer) domain-containing protein
MTAHALKGDRERCLEAGMNDYLSKPLNPEAVSSVLREWLPEHSDIETDHVEDTESAAEGETQGKETELFDAERLRAYTHGDEEHMRELVETFLRDIPSHVQEIQRGVRSGEWEDVRSVAHALKGASSTLHAEKLRAAAERVEHAAAKKAAGITAGEGEQAEHGKHAEHGEQSGAASGADGSEKSAVNGQQSLPDSLIDSLESILHRTTSEMRKLIE